MCVDMGGGHTFGREGSQGGGVHDKGGSQGGSRKGGFPGGFTKRGVHMNPLNPPPPITGLELVVISRTWYE